jgi:hypothetical protein
MSLTADAKNSFLDNQEYCSGALNSKVVLGEKGSPRGTRLIKLQVLEETQEGME